MAQETSRNANKLPPQRGPDGLERPPLGSQQAESSATGSETVLAIDAVTPDIHHSAYIGQASPDHPGESPSYFSRSDRPIAAEPEAIAQSPSEAAAGAKSGVDILRRMSLTAMGRRESLSEIRAANPDLGVSGNIISATFNIPYSFKHHKGADWVSSNCCW